MALPMALAGLLAPEPVGGVLLGLAIGLPGLLVQDGVRISFFALGRPARSAAMDAIWVFAQILVFGAIFAWTKPGAGLLMFGWGAAAQSPPLSVPGSWAFDLGRVRQSGGGAKTSI